MTPRAREIIPGRVLNDLFLPFGSRRVGFRRTLMIVGAHFGIADGVRRFGGLDQSTKRTHCGVQKHDTFHVHRFPDQCGGAFKGILFVSYFRILQILRTPLVS
jgi:hypothetical protein